MQHRRIVDAIVRRGRCDPAARSSRPTRSRACTHRCVTGTSRQWSRSRGCTSTGFPEHLRAIPLVEPVRSHSVGLVMLDQDPEPLLARALRGVAAEHEIAAAFDAADPSG